MRNNDIGLLRSLIREMVNEAPYRSSQRVTLSGVPQVGTPDIRGTLVAAGITGLIQLYDWTASLCTVDEKNNMFPIMLSKEASQKVVAALPNAFDATFPGYKTSIAQASGSVGTDASDLAKLEDLHAKVVAARGAWGTEVTTKVGLGDAKTAPLDALKAVLGVYTGCGGNITLNDIPMETRAEYIKFLNDIGDLSTETFKTGLAEQLAKIVVQHPTKKAEVEAVVNASTKYASDKWKPIKATLAPQK